MTETAERLRQETDEWEEKLASRLRNVSATDAEGEELLENARAYLSDADHFRDEEDLVRAFEAVIWGWSWLEIGERIGKIQDG